MLAHGDPDHPEAAPGGELGRESADGSAAAYYAGRATGRRAARFAATVTFGKTALAKVELPDIV